MALLIYRERSTYVKEKLIYVFFSAQPSLCCTVSKYLLAEQRGNRKKNQKRVVSVYLLHIELLRSGLDALVLDTARQNSWTFVSVQLFAVSYLLLTGKL
jgi:hypothetical protein